MIAWTGPCNLEFCELSFFVIFSIGPHNLEFLAKNPLSFWPKAKILSFFGLEFFAKCTKKQAWT